MNAQPRPWAVGNPRDYHIPHSIRPRRARTAVASLRRRRALISVNDALTYPSLLRPPPVSPRAMQVLRIHVTSESDPFFFHHMEVSEEEFQALKTEQSILVDFAQFPDKFIELLEECIGSRGEVGRCRLNRWNPC